MRTQTSNEPIESLNHVLGIGQHEIHEHLGTERNFVCLKKRRRKETRELDVGGQLQLG